MPAMLTVRFRDSLLPGALALAGFAGGAHAQTGSPQAPPTVGAETAIVPPEVDPEVVRIAEARRRYAQGAEFFRRARYSEAVAELTEAYRLWENPTILYALAQAYEGLSEATRAIETYQLYLDNAPEDDVRRADALAKIGELRGLLATVHVASNVPATVFVDGEPRGDVPGDVRIPTGRHTVELRAEGYEPQTEVVTVAGGTERSLGFELQPVPARVVRVERERFRFPRSVFYTSLGLTGAGLATWTTMASIAVVRANDYNDLPGSSSFDRDDAREIARYSNVALAVSGGLGVTTALIGALTRWGDEPGDEPPLDVTAGLEPVVGGAVLTARWSR